MAKRRHTVQGGVQAMKVLLANKFFYRKGGAEAVMLMEREVLQGAGVDVVEFAMRDERNLASRYAASFVSPQIYDDRAMGVAQRVGTALHLVHSREAVRRIGELIDATAPDLVHCHNVYHQLTPSIIGAAKRRALPVLLTLHDYKPICPVYTRLRRGRPCSQCAYKKFFNVVKYRCAGGSIARSALLYVEAEEQLRLSNYETLDAIVAPSLFMRDSVTLARFPPERVHVIRNGVDTRSIRPGREDGGYALYLGRLVHEKGIETLLEAHASLGGRVRLCVAGTGPLEAELKRRFPLADFLGHLDGKALDDVVGRAGFVVVPSEWYENCPVSVLEAMAYGKAVVASDIGGIPELVTHGRSGLLFPAGDRAALADCLAQLAEDEDLRRAYGQAGRLMAEQCFSLEQHAAQLLGLYRQLIDGAAAPRRADGHRLAG
jgi:glycosyltransferase involved in cell wall biosynthesis